MSELMRLEAVKTNRFKTIDLNVIDNNPDLSWKAKGIWVYLISRPPGWKFYFSDLLKRSTDGETAVRNGIKELQEHGYLLIQKIQDKKRRWIGTKWIVTEDPDSLPLPNDTVVQIDNEQETRNVENRVPGNPDPGEQHPSIYHSSKYHSQKETKYMQRVKTTLRSKRKSLKGLSKKEVVELYRSSPEKPPKGYTRPQMLAGILDHTPGMEQVVERYGWRTIMLRLGQLFNGHRKVHLKYRDVMESAIELDKIPAPYSSPPSIDYLVATLTNMAENKMADRFEVEAQARKDQVEDRDLLDALADNFRMPE